MSVYEVYLKRMKSSLNQQLIAFYKLID